MSTTELKKDRLSEGWRANLHLSFIEKDKKTVLKECAHCGPLQVQKPFYPERNGPCHVYILHPPGGVVGGDDLDVKIEIHPKAKVLITTPAACKFYRSGGAIASQKQTIKVATQGVLEWFPLESIFFSGAKVKLETRVHLSDESHFIGWDILCLGRPAAGEQFSQGNLTQKFDIFKNGRPLRLDRIVLGGNDPVLVAKWGLGGAAVLGSFFCLTPRKELVDLLRKNIDSFEGAAFFSVTYVDDVILCRYLGNSVEQVKQSFIKVWHIMRLALLDYKAVIPRVWST